MDEILLNTNARFKTKWGAWYYMSKFGYGFNQHNTPMCQKPQVLLFIYNNFSLNTNLQEKINQIKS